MESPNKKKTSISRRGILPLFVGSMLLPFLGFSNTKTIDLVSSNEEEENNEYQTLLRPDGTAVKVKVSTIKKAKIIEQNVSNKSLLNWLGRKL